MLSHVAEAEAKAGEGATDEAITIIEDLRKHVDGCGAAADNNDWVVACQTQEVIRGRIDALLEYLLG